VYPSNYEIQLYIKKLGERGSKSLRLLGEKQDFVTAFNSKIGQELLGEVIQMHELLFNKVASTHATDEDRIEYQVVGRLLGLWATKIAEYERRCKEIITIASREKERERKEL